MRCRTFPARLQAPTSGRVALCQGHKNTLEANLLWITATQCPRKWHRSPPANSGLKQHNQDKKTTGNSFKKFKRCSELVFDPLISDINYTLSLAVNLWPFTWSLWNSNSETEKSSFSILIWIYIHNGAKPLFFLSQNLLIYCTLIG